MYIRIFDICVRGYGASVCVSVVERGLLVRVPSPWGGLLGGRRWSSRERTVASRRSDRKRGVAVQHVTNVLFLGRERTPPCRNHASTHLFPPWPSIPGNSCGVSLEGKRKEVATFGDSHWQMSTTHTSKRICFLYLILFKQTLSRIQ